MNILVTGGARYIGSHVVEQLVQNKKNRIYIFDNLSTGYKKLIHKKAFFIKGDIKNKKLLKKIFEKFNIKVIFHFAACLNVSEAEKKKDKYYNNNVIGTKNLVSSINASNIKYFVFSSSCSIYGNTKSAVSEKRKPNPQGYYAYTKYKAERIIIEYAKKYNYKYGILRYFNVAGASPSGKIGEVESSYGHLIKNIAIESLKKKPKIKIFGNNYLTKDGTCIRDYVHVSDLAEIHIKGLNYLKKNKSFTLNCGYGKGYSVLEIVNIFKKINKNLIIKYCKRRPGDIAKVYSNTKKLKKIFNWRPKHNNLIKIIKSSIAWEKKLKTN